MGDGSLTEVKPGLRFSVVSSEVSETASGIRVGLVSLRCEIRDKDLWKIALQELSELQVTGSLAEELSAALDHELERKETELELARLEILELRNTLALKEAELKRLSAVMRGFRKELGF